MTDDPYATMDRYGRPVRPVIGPSGQLLGYARNDMERDPAHIPAMSPTPDGAYPDRPPRLFKPQVRPLTEAERLALADAPDDPEQLEAAAAILGRTAAALDILAGAERAQLDGEAVAQEERELGALERERVARQLDALGIGFGCPARVWLYESDGPFAPKTGAIVCDLASDHPGRHRDPFRGLYW